MSCEFFCGFEKKLKDDMEIIRIEIDLLESLHKFKLPFVEKEKESYCEQVSSDMSRVFCEPIDEKVKFTDDFFAQKNEQQINSVSKGKKRKYKNGLEDENELKLKLVKPNFKPDSKYWLNDLQIDKALEAFQLYYPNVTIYTIAKTECALRIEKKFLHNLLEHPNLIFLLHSINHWIVLTNIKKKICMYESLNQDEYIEGLKQFFSIMFPQKKKIVINKIWMKHLQRGSNDCGLFALAYINSLCKGREPSLIQYNQDTMRQNFNNFIDGHPFLIDEISDATDTHLKTGYPYTLSLEN